MFEDDDWATYDAQHDNLTALILRSSEAWDNGGYDAAGTTEQAAQAACEDFLMTLVIGALVGQYPGEDSIAARTAVYDHLNVLGAVAGIPPMDPFGPDFPVG